jgi:hypothetical protein
MTEIIRTPNVDTIPRDSYGRYRLPNPETGEATVTWTRVTTIANTLKDRYGLEQWTQRNIVWGMGQRRDLCDRAAASTKDDKRTLSEIVREADGAAASKAGAHSGSAVHQFTERLDAGEVIYPPEPMDRDVEAYRQLRDGAGLDVIAIEAVVCIPELAAVGTLDRLYRLRDGRIIVGDVKTGKDAAKWGSVDIPLQLALYAAASWWWDGKGWQPWTWEIDQQRGLLIHIPLGAGQAEPYWVDLDAGASAVHTAMTVREWRTRRDVIWPARDDLGLVAATRGDVDSQQPSLLLDGSGEAALPSPQPSPPVTNGDLLDWVRQRVEVIKTDPEAAATLAQWWSTRPDIPTFPNGGPTTPEDIDVVADWVNATSKAHGLPFPDEPDPRAKEMRP